MTNDNFQLPITNIETAYKFIFQESFREELTKYDESLNYHESLILNYAKYILIHLWETQFNKDKQIELYSNLIQKLSQSNKTSDIFKVKSFIKDNNQTINELFKENPNIFYWDAIIRTFTIDSLNKAYKDQFENVYCVLFDLLNENIEHLIANYNITKDTKLFNTCNELAAVYGDVIIYDLS